MDLTVTQPRWTRWNQKLTDVRYHARLFWAEARAAYGHLVLGRGSSSLADALLVVTHSQELIRLTDYLALTREPAEVDYADYPGLHLLERIGPTQAFFASQRVVLELAASHPEYDTEEMLELIQFRLEARLMGRISDAGLLRSLANHPAGRGRNLGSQGEAS